MNDGHVDVTVLADEVAEWITRRYGLTTQQGRVMELMVVGRRNPEIALVLGITVHTVRSHVAAIFVKTGIDGREEVSRLILEAIAARLEQR